MMADCDCDCDCDVVEFRLQATSGNQKLLRNRVVQGALGLLFAVNLAVLGYGTDH
jgi:hypothetical protein